MIYRSNLPGVLNTMQRARWAGLIAAATVLVNAVKEGLRGGYKSGAFVTGNVLNSVTRSEPDLARGMIEVGTNVKYAIFWELSHFNLFTRRIERKEVWVPALYQNRQTISEAYARAFRRVLMGSA